MRQKKKKERSDQQHNERLIKYEIMRDIRTLFEQQEGDYYKPNKLSHFWNNNYIEYENNGDKNSN